MSSPNSTSSINVTDQSITLSQHQQNLETLNRMGMFFHQQMQFDVKSRLGLTQASVSQGPRHTIDAILGLNARQRVSDFDRREGECETVPVSPGAAESAGK